MVATTADYPIDSPARQMVRRSSSIMPVNVSAFVDKAHLRGADAICLDLEIEPTAEGTELLYPKLFVVLLARQAGLYPMGTMRGVADFRDLDGYRVAVQTAATVGYRGASCIHPAQVTILNEVFSPPADRVAYARRVVEVYDEAEAQGRASVALDGQIVDIPVVLRAQRLIARADRVAAMEERKRAALAASGEGV